MQKDVTSGKLHKQYNLMFFWPCIMKWLYINYQLDALITLVNKILAHERFIVFLT